MSEINKKELFEQAQKQASAVVEKIQNTYFATVEIAKKIRQRLKRTSGADQIIDTQVLENSEQRVFELEHLKSSPYFVRCEVLFEDKPREEIFFSKFNFSEENIYSWTAPAASVRFESPGDVSYKLPNGIRKEGRMFRKDQFMIVEGKIIFMASETVSTPRQLIHQEHLMAQKNSFVLPEIVELMEKKQDEVIRADFHGSYLISGPAGSGKTTLALHRAAYLALSPDTAEHFASGSIIVFVHDNSTKKYFSSLLPQLGINNAVITIFSDWAKEILGLASFGAVYRFGESEAEQDLYEYLKNKALKESGESAKSPEQLIKIYSQYFSEELQERFKQQLEQKLLDRFDLTFLLKSQFDLSKGFKRLVSYVALSKSGKETIKRGLRPIEYSLIIVDEAENYLKEQIDLIKSCADKNRAVLYVGDLAQQTKLCTIKDWQEVGENFKGDRKVELFRVYRNTKEILTYIKNQGYEIVIPEELKSGSPVKECLIDNTIQEEKYIKEIVEENPKAIIGVLQYDGAYLQRYKEDYKDSEKVFILSIDEAQGVEFDIVIFLNYETDFDYDAYGLELAEEKKRVRKDLDYVAMTRAMGELHVLKS